MARAVRSKQAMPSRLEIVVGKGGVGKSTVSAAFAIAAFRRGARVLAIEVEEAAGLSRAFGVEPDRPGTIVKSPSGVCLAWVEGTAALAEYLERKVRLGPMLQPVLRHPLYRAFVAAAPGLGELLLIGKVRDELVLQKKWDTVVLDAGASGHALELLRMSSVAAKTFRSGRVHREALRVHGLLADPERARVHVVATPERMAIAEAIDLNRRVSEIGLSIGALIVNACRAPAPRGIEATLARLPGSELGRALLELANRALGWQRLQARAIAELETATGRQTLRLPLLAAPVLGAHELVMLSRFLEELVA